MTQLVIYGTANGITITASETAATYSIQPPSGSMLVKVTLSYDYHRTLPPGYNSGLVDPNAFATNANAPALTAGPNTIPNGTTIGFFAAESAALIAAGVATAA